MNDWEKRGERREDHLYPVIPADDHVPSPRVKRFSSGTKVIVDLSLCGSRSSNYANSPQFGGASAVEAAMKQMSGEGVKVAERVEWI